MINKVRKRLPGYSMDNQRLNVSFAKYSMCLLQSNMEQQKEKPWTEVSLTSLIPVWKVSCNYVREGHNATSIK
jgi:hypothetical protein